MYCSVGIGLEVVIVAKKPVPQEWRVLFCSALLFGGTDVID
jgi:hypothetical protein